MRNRIRNTIFLTMSFMVLFSLTVWAQPPVGGSGRPGPERGAEPAPIPSRFLERADADGDGKISRDEFLEAQERIFKQLDTNADGVIDMVERIQVGRRIRENAPLAQPGERGKRQIGQMDADKDGKISTKEFKGAEERFKEMDKNEDGFLTPDEMKPGFKGHSFIEEGRPRFRKGGESEEPKESGRPRPRLREESHPAGPDKAVKGLPKEAAPDPLTAIRQRFERIDANKDGRITPGEFKGNPERFKRMDANSDGFLTPDEMARRGERK